MVSQHSTSKQKNPSSRSPVPSIPIKQDVLDPASDQRLASNPSALPRPAPVLPIFGRCVAQGPLVHPSTVPPPAAGQTRSREIGQTTRNSPVMTPETSNPQPNSQRIVREHPICSLHKGGHDTARRQWRRRNETRSFNGRKVRGELRTQTQDIVP